MSSVFEQVQRFFRRGFFMVEKILQAGAVVLVRQQAAAAGVGKIGDVELFGQRKLRFAGPAGDRVEAFPPDPAVSFRHRLGKPLHAQGPNDISFEAGIFFHIAQRIPGLRHGTLTQNLSAEQEIVPARPHRFSGQAKHQCVTIETGVHMLAVSAPGVCEHLHIFGGDVSDGQGDADVPGGFHSFF